MNESRPVTPTVLWWGRHDPSYSRNAVLRQCFAHLGWRVLDFRPFISALGAWQAPLVGMDDPDLIWVPCFRQRDVVAAARFARSRGIPIVADPLISSYDKQVNERRKLEEGSARARSLLAWERGVLTRVDRVVADTRGHADYFHDVLDVERDRLFVVPVGADESLFRCAPLPSRENGVEVLFYGSFLALQGPEFIVQAALMLAQPGIRVTLLGSGPLHEQCVRLAGNNERVRFEPWLDYPLLPARIHRAHLCLGVFGVTPKAGRVIANKVYQCLASGRPVITRVSDAYPSELLEQPWSAGLRFVEPGAPAALAAAIDAFATSNAAVAHLQAREIYDRFFSQASVTASLAALLASMGLPAGSS